MINTALFDWSDYDNDIHIGIVKTYKDYRYRNNESRSAYFKRWYEKNKEKHIANVRAGQSKPKANVFS